MSTPVPARPDTTQGTRQLLDELDALMQRMLAVPVNELGDVVEARGPAVQSTETPTGARHSETLPDARTAVPMPGPPPPGGALLSTHQAAPAMPAPHHLPQPDRSKLHVPQVTASPAPDQVPLGGFWPHPALQSPHLREVIGQPATAPPQWSPRPGPRLSGGQSTPTPTARRPMTGWWLHSLLWSNRAFDRCTARLGHPGRWLQGRGGRRVLGWLGIGLLLGSVAWGLGNWFDWTW
jgi:hypothetical protein